MRAMPRLSSLSSGLRLRYAILTGCASTPQSEVERQDMQAFSRWFFRERGWRWIVYLAGATTLVAWGVSRLPLNLSFTKAALLLNVVAFMMAWACVGAWFGYRKFQGKALRSTLITLIFVPLGAAVGGTVADFAQGRPPFAWFTNDTSFRSVVITSLAFGFLYAVTVALIANLRHRVYLEKTARLEGEARQSELDRRLAESQLRLLQLQIEPHFLFNTLGSAQQLAEKGAPDAARLIADLIRFLRASTQSLRENATTLKQDAAMVAAYLAIMQTRLRERLRYTIDIPDTVGKLSIPPGMLITLVENAIKHGIEPSPAGGAIAVSAQLFAGDGDARLAIVVADTGAGLSGSAPGQGIGLANIRERLTLLYGERASLELEENEPRGFRARLTLPAPPQDAAARATTPTESAASVVDIAR
jgi:signal transduction histidine kinase